MTMRSTGCRISPALALLLAALMLVGTAAGIDVWAPGTGEVDLEEVPRDSAEARFRHAAALIAAGQPVSAAAQLRELLAQHPQAKWAEQATYLLGMALFSTHQYENAFGEWEGFHGKYPESALRRVAYEFQLQTAIARTREDLENGQKLFDRLIAIAPDKEFAVRCQKEKADVTLSLGRFFMARDEYLTLVDFFPDSPWVPYAWFKVAECDLRLAMWIKRGTEYLENAQRGFEDFLVTFPDHVLAKEAQEKLDQVRTQRAKDYRRIAEYYMGPGLHPVSALPYLQLITETVPDTELAQWAEEKTKEVRQTQQAPLRGEVKDLSVPGVAPAEPVTEPVKPEEPAR